MKINLIADAHIKERTWANYSGLRGDAQAVCGILETMSDMPLIVAGDTFDTPRPTAAEYGYFADSVWGYPSVMYITGNHDDADWLGYIPISVKLSAPMVLPGTEDVKISGVSWREGNTREALLRRLMDIRNSIAPGDSLILVLHTGFRELCGFDDAWSLEVADIERIFADCHVYVIVGHIHTRRTLQTAVGWVHSPGSLYPTSVTEMGSDFAVTQLDTDTWELSDIPIKVREYRELVYDGSSQTSEQLLSMLSEARASNNNLPPYIRIKLESGVDIPDIPDDLRNAAIVHYIASGSATDILQDTTPTAAAIGMEDSIRAAVGDDPDMCGMILELFAADNPLQLADSWVDFWKATRRQ